MSYMNLDDVFNQKEKKLQAEKEARQQFVGAMESQMNQVRSKIIDPLTDDLRKLVEASNDNLGVHVSKSVLRYRPDSCFHYYPTSEEEQVVTVYFGRAATVIRESDDINRKTIDGRSYDSPIAQEKISFEFNHKGALRIQSYDSLRHHTFSERWKPDYDGPAAPGEIARLLGEWMFRVMEPQKIEALQDTIFPKKQMRSQKPAPSRSRSILDWFRG